MDAPVARPKHQRVMAGAVEGDAGEIFVGGEHSSGVGHAIGSCLVIAISSSAHDSHDMNEAVLHG